MLDLKNRANVLQFMKIVVDESPIIPYEIYRRYIAGSPNGHITLSGDVIGPIFPEDTPVQLESMFPTGHGRFGKGIYCIDNNVKPSFYHHFLEKILKISFNDCQNYIL